MLNSADIAAGFESQEFVNYIDNCYNEFTEYNFNYCAERRSDWLHKFILHLQNPWFRYHIRQFKVFNTDQEFKQFIADFLKLYYKHLDFDTLSYAPSFKLVMNDYFFNFHSMDNEELFKQSLKFKVYSTNELNALISKFEHDKEFWQLISEYQELSAGFINRYYKYLKEYAAHEVISKQKNLNYCSDFVQRELRSKGTIVNE